MFRKSIFAMAVAASSLFAAEKSASVRLDFTGKDWNVKSIKNYYSLVKFNFKGEKDGKKCLLLTKRIDPKHGDSAWSIGSRIVPFEGKKGTVVVTIEVCSNLDLAKVAGKTYSSKLVWLDGTGKEIGVLPLKFNGKAEKFTAFQTKGTIPEGTKAFQFFLGFDSPNFADNSFFACSSVLISIAE